MVNDGSVRRGRSLQLLSRFAGAGGRMHRVRRRRLVPLLAVSGGGALIASLAMNALWLVLVVPLLLLIPLTRGAALAATLVLVLMSSPLARGGREATPAGRGDGSAIGNRPASEGETRRASMFAASAPVSEMIKFICAPPPMT